MQLPANRRRSERQAEEARAQSTRRDWIAVAGRFTGIALRRPRRFPRPPLTLGIAACAVLLLELGLWSAIRFEGQQVLLVAAAAAAVSIPIIGAIRRDRLDLFELGVAIALFYFMLFPMRALVVLGGFGQAAHHRLLNPTPEAIRLSLMAAVVGLVAGGLAYESRIGATLGARVRIPAPAELDRPSVWLGMAVLAVGLTAEGLVLAANRTIGSTDLDLAGRRTAGVVSAATVFVIVGLFLLVRRAALRESRLHLLALGLGIVATLAVGVVGAYKEAALLSIAVPLLTWHFSVREGIRFRWLAMSAVVALFVIFPLVQLMRLASDREQTADPIRTLTAVPEQYWRYSLVDLHRRRWQPWTPVIEPMLSVSRRLYGYDSLTLAVMHTPSVIPYQHGRQTFSQLAWGVVPRVVWPDKPSIGMGYWFAVNYWSTDEPGVPVVPQTVTHPGELWIDFAMPGVAIGMALLGFWYRFAWTALRPSESAAGALLYTVLFITVVDVGRDLPFAYVTLVQRLVAAVLLVFAFVALRRLFVRVRRVVGRRGYRRPLLGVGRRVRHRHVMSALGTLEPRSRVLDAGCGDGRLAVEFARRNPDSRVVGIDDDEASLARAVRAGSSIPNLEFRLHPIGGTSLRQQFDIVVCIDVLEHIADDEAAVAWLAEHLTPGGSLLLHVPASPQRHWVQSVERELRADIEARRDPHVRQGYASGELTRLLHANGLEPVAAASTFHRKLTQIGEDVDMWLFRRRARAVKALLLPFLLLAASVESRPATQKDGYGLLLSARKLPLPAEQPAVGQTTR